MAKGKDLSELVGKLKDANGKIANIDDGVAYIKEAARQAGGGNAYAAVELNEIRTFAIQPILLEELKLLGWMGRYDSLGYNDTVYATKKRLVGDKSRFQASGGDVVFPAWEYDKYPVSTVTISGGYQIDYRKIQFGNLEDEEIGMQQVRTDKIGRAHV